MIDPRRVFVRYASAVLLCGLTASVSAEHVERVIDIRVGPASTNPVALTEMNGVLYFGADEFGSSADLWRSDGTAAGTSLVARTGAVAELLPITEMVRAGNVLFYVVPRTTSQSSRLLKSDGTPAGSSTVKNFCLPPCGSPSQLTHVNGVVYFTLSTPELGTELYRTDGTTSGTVLVKDIRPGTAGSDPSSLVAFQGQLYFSASDGTLPLGTLWKSDGTAAGTTPVVPGFNGPLDPAGLTIMGSKLYLAANQATGPRSLWETDGTAAGLRVLSPAAPWLNPENLRAADSKLYFSGSTPSRTDDELYQYDGTAVTRVADIAFGPASSSPRDLVATNGFLYFSADDGVTGRELWRVATAGGAPSLVEDIAPGPGSSNPRGIVEVNGTLFFTADGPDGAEVWRSDGTAGGTRILHDIAAGAASSDPAQYTAVVSAAGTNVFFTASSPDDGNELRVMRNARPTANAGPDRTIAPGQTVTLSSAGSVDPDGDPITFEWRNQAGGIVGTAPTLTVTVPASTTYSLTVRDGFGGVASDTVIITVTGGPMAPLVVLVSGTGVGSVSIDPPGATCTNANGPGNCQFQMGVGTQVTLVATPAANSTFLGFTGCSGGTGSTCIYIVGGDTGFFVQAQFSGPVPFPVTVEGIEQGTGSVLITPPNVTCTTPNTCTNSYLPGTTVQLTSSPSADSVFVGWSGMCTGTAPTCLATLLATQSQSATARFRGPVRLSVDVQSVENGSGAVRIDPPNVDCVVAPGSANLCDNLYRIGSVVQLNATPSANSIFLGWTAGACTGNTPTCSVTMDQAKAVQATFRGPVLLSVDVRTVENGSGVVHIDPPNTDCVVVPGSAQLCDNLYRIGSVVQLDATPSANSIFLGWTAGPCTGNLPTCTVTMDQAKAVQATFRGPVLLSVDVRSVENGSGAVHIDPPNTDCVVVPGSAQLCDNLYRIGSVVQLNATPSANSIFLGWSAGACTGNSPTCAVTMDQAKAVQATFRGPVALTVDVRSVENGSGAVHIDPPNTDCVVLPGSAQLCENLYRIGSVVQLNATPSANSTFLGWAAGACTGSSPTCSVTMDQAKAVQATFRGSVALSVDVQSAQGGSGTVNITPPNVDCTNVPGSPLTCQNSYAIGTVVQLTATPSIDSIFVGWTAGACTGTTPTCSVTMDDAKAVQATFRGRTLALSVVSEQNGAGAVYVAPIGQICEVAAGGTQSCAYRYAAGASVTLTAIPSSGDTVFAGWSGGLCSGTSTTCDLTIGEVNLVTAVFRGPEVLTLNVQSGDGGAGSMQIFPYGNPCVVAPGASETCTHVFPRGTLITLLPHAEPGSAWDGWSGPCTGQSPFCQFVLDQPTSVTAVFRRTETLTITLTGNAGARGFTIAMPAGSGCELAVGETQVTCTSSHVLGTELTITAYFEGYNVFLGWTGCAAVPGTNTCTLTIGGPAAVTAAFRTNALPNVVAGGPYDAEKGQAITFDSTGTSDPDGDALTYRWEFGDGTTATGPTPTHTYVIGGNYEVILYVSDGFWTTTGVAPATIHNHGPVANAGGPYTGSRGVPVTFDGTASTDPEGDPLTYRWDFGDGTGWSGTGPTPTHTYDAQGTYPVTLTIDDGWGPSEPSTVEVAIVNRPPVVITGGPYTAAHGVPVTFDGSGSYDPDGDAIIFYHWVFGDGEEEFGEDAHPTHVYPAGGTFVLTLYVYDSFAEYGEATTTVTIPNQRPIANPGGPYTGTRRDSIVFNGTGSTDPDGDPLTYAWDFGVFGGGNAPIEQAAFGELGTFPITLVVSDGAATSLPVTTTVTIVNMLPTVSAGGPYIGARGDAVQFYGTADDPDFDPLTYAWTFGDGGTGSGENPSHVYTAFGTFTVRLTVSDGHGTVVATTSVTVANQPPVANAGGPYSGTRGVNIAFTGSGTDPDGDSLTYRWNFGDGGTANGRTPNHKYTTFGTFVVTLVVNDGRLDSAPSTTEATVPDRRPIANANGPYTGVRGTAITFSGTGSVDPDGNPITYQWNFGDGTTGTGKNPTHVYTTVGSFTARLVVSDGAQTSLESTAAVTISNRAPVARTGGPYAGKRALAVQFNGSTSSDPDGDPLTYAWNFGDGASGTGVSPTHVYATLGAFTVTLTVNDGFVTSPAATTTATITNAVPIANAGADRTVLRQTAVTLDGRASSDPDGTISTWSWRQLSGPSVSLSGANTSQPSFTAPNVNNSTALNFELKVTDNNGATAVDTVRITVIR